MTDAVDGPEAGREGVVITREALRDGSLLAALRRRAPPDMTIRSDAELDASLDEALAGRDPAEDAWVFGYGSLMWNPAFAFAERRPGRLHGWRRRFCLWLRMGRGTPSCPGLMLALDRGGSCEGVAFRIPAAQARAELLLVWRREMLGGAYLARWVTVRTGRGAIRAVTFVANRRHDRYAGAMDEAEVAARIAAARGELGSCAAYLRQTVEHLRALGVHDRRMERIEALVARSRRPDEARMA